MPSITPQAAPVQPTADAATASWPALFGSEPVAPPPPPPAADPAPAPPTPTELSVSYVLKGLIARTDGGWAIISDGTSDQLLRKGDSTASGEQVVSISSAGVLIERDGLQKMITFDPADTSSPTADEPPSGITPAPQDGAKPPPGPAPLAMTARPLPDITLRMSDFDGERLRDIVTRAGGLGETTFDDGTVGLEILWVRNGLLYDRISLRKGDKIKSINGRAIAEAQSTASVLQALMQARTFELELIRNDALRSLRVEVQDAD